ncbi:MAG: lactate/malate family dehydrogenase [Atopobiaceae bacterium]|jgi:L-lactate dehydrogenase
MAGAKVGIIGNSHVGAHVANALLSQSLVSELYLSDKDVKLCRAQVNDLLDAMSFYPHSAKVVECDDRYEELADCDVIVNAAGHVAQAAESRDGELFITTDEAKTFAKRLADAGFDGVWVSVANPNDVVALAIQKLGNFDPYKVIGSGTTLDSSRFQHALSAKTGFDPQCISALMLGEHGFDEFALWSHVSFGALTPEEVEESLGISFDRDGLEEQARKGGYISMEGKRCTEYSIANGTVKIIKAVLNDTKIVTPVSTYMDGSAYGIKGIYSSLPCMVGKNGVEKVFVPNMSEQEITKWHASSKHIADNVRQIDWLRELAGELVD